jgi:hypothetical protein
MPGAWASTRRRALTLALALALCAGARGGAAAEPAFDHDLHEDMFASCVACHRGAEEPAAPMFPRAEACAACHDGDTAGRIEWGGRESMTPGNLRFVHAEHAARAGEEETVLACDDCHAAGGAPGERKASADGCFVCHGAGEHLDVANDCAQCHLSLGEAAGLTSERIAAFPRPAWHDEADFASSGHGSLCSGAAGGGSTSRCAVCHARNFCEACHVDTASQPAIEALSADERSLVHRAVLRAPATHSEVDFLHGHGMDAQGGADRCATCHTRESCTVCHVATPGVAGALAPAAAGRPRGAVVRRRAPASHDALFRETHGTEAAADPTSCAACHSREQCLDCHLPAPASGPPGYHPPDFLARHPAAAYARETSCSDCHQPGSFCATCHENAGLSSNRAPLGAGYHDAKEQFLFGHGPAARRALETCVTCHTENDCMVCHSAVSGRRFNPHGPGFDAERLRARAPQVCTVCHGAIIPGG